MILLGDPGTLLAEQNSGLRVVSLTVPSAGRWRHRGSGGVGGWRGIRGGQ